MKKPLNLPLLILGGLGVFWAINKMAERKGKEGILEFGKGLERAYGNRTDQAIKDALK